MLYKKKIKVLLFEDSDSDAELIKLELDESEMNYEARHARNKEKFLAYLDSFKPDIILSDYWVPGFDGFQALGHLKKNDYDIPFVLVTGTLGEEKAVATILAGATDFILKDNLQNLPAAVLRALKSAQERKARKQAVEALEKSERYFRGLIENNHDPIFTFNSNSVITYASPTVKKVLGYEVEELVGKYIPELLHSDDREKRVNTLEDLVEGKIQRLIARLQVIKKDGEYRWLEARISDQRQVEGIKAFVANLRDIHEYVLADQKLQEQNQLLDSVIKNLGEGLIVADQKRNVLLHNKMAERIMGIKLDNYNLPMDISQIYGIFKEDGTTQYKVEELPLCRVIKGETIQNEEMVLQQVPFRKGDAYLGINGRPLKDPLSGQVLAGILSFRDITDKKLYQKELEKTLGMLEHRVKERTAELLSAHKNLAQAHKLMTYSINYAKRIQQAILPSEEDLHKLFQKSFMIFFPRDIVSGDFVWINSHGSERHIAIADCTGHGVPGAMVSMIGNELLDRIVVDRRIHKPDVILKELDKSINGMLNKSDKIHTANDGMDISFCSFDIKKKSLSFSGAHNDGLLVRDNNVITLRASRRSIGGMLSERLGDFEEIRVETRPGDRIYLFTDGFSDQFGGPNIKKFTKRRLREMILDIQHYSMHDQQEIILHKFHQWKGNQEQIDDITLVGIEL